MNSYSDKIQQNKKQTTPHTATQKKKNTALTHTDISSTAQIQLQEIANKSEQVKYAVQLQEMANTNSSSAIQKKGIEEEELQMKSIPVQRQTIEEEDPLQKKDIPVQRQSIEEEEPLQKKAIPIQKKGIEEEEPLQGKFASPIQKKENNTGLPDNLKSGIENLSGYSMDDVKVHYNSDKPAQLQAHAYAQGTDIHIASGQEKHLPHEAWHVVQQKQGRVQPTLQMKGNVNVNDDAGLENEADVMGAKAVTTGVDVTQSYEIERSNFSQEDRKYASPVSNVAQRGVNEDIVEAKGDIQNTEGYAKSVLAGVTEYAEKIYFVDNNKTSHPALPAEVIEMAGGLKAWAANYYNKAQANLYEAQKTNDHTIVGSTLSRWILARLGQDTDKEPDMQSLEVGQHSDGQIASDRRATELKTCTTAGQQNVAKLVQEGLAQLQKREATGKYTSLLLTVHNDHPANKYPYTDTDVIDFKDQDAINNKLIERINATTKGSGIKLKLEVRLEHKGKRYATVFYN
ncbi:DUF4157 domain-containing protein [Flavobacterium sp. TR2]|uniref:eCIS core domain-containing protein n=1 Tax=Flavobacterium sp. TR2 TaxID=2977321 RepID=UPI0021B14290|nr:DUF4157 domain-containing protein [Flavobacterium sp. TR2]UWY27407.1 DUF4157 domain-containing protein [Flavobacterium sp. TR2]